ncbi:MAG: thiamine pyrophosphate-dependent enzyme [Candidatus Bathyarchaeia archaeon]
MSKRLTIQQIALEEMTISPGSACQGCGPALAARLTFKALGPNTIRHGVPCCPDSSTLTPRGGAVFEGGGASLTGTWRALKMLGKEDVNVVGFFGDGGTYDIGFQGISAAAERNDNIMVICKDNEAYMNTGNQRSGATPLYAQTTTTPAGSHPTRGKGKPRPKKNIPMIFAAHGVPYVATASIAFPADLIAKVEYAKSVKGFKMIIIHSPCPTGWRYDPGDTVKVARLAVQTGMWALYDVVDGRKFQLTYKPKELRPVGEYLGTQGRFRHLTPDMTEEIQKMTTDNWERLLKLDEAKEVLL